MDAALARMRAGLNPDLSGRLGEFRDALARFRAVPRRQTVVAVVGLVPSAGRTTLTGLVALTAAAYSDRRVVVIDTAASASTVGLDGAADATAATDPTAVAGMAGGRTVTRLLGGDVADGRVRALLDIPVTTGVPRRRIAAALTPGTAAPVLSLAPGSGDFTPQMLEQAVERLRHRADLVVVDTPPGPAHPVLHAALDLADRFLLVVRGDHNADAQIAAGLGWLAAAPGRRRDRTTSVVAVCRGLRPVGPSTPGVAVLGRDEALRRRRLDQLSRRSAVTALRLATLAVDGR